MVAHCDIQSPRPPNGSQPWVWYLVWPKLSISQDLLVETVHFFCMYFSHHGDQDNQDVDQIDDKDPLCIEDDVDDDDENDNHQAIDLQNDDVVGDGHNDDVDNDNKTSRKCLPNSLYPPIVNNPTQILSFPLINPKRSAMPSENTPMTLSSR